MSSLMPTFMKKIWISECETNLVKSARKQIRQRANPKDRSHRFQKSCIRAERLVQNSNGPRAMPPPLLQILMKQEARRSRERHTVDSHVLPPTTPSSISLPYIDGKPFYTPALAVLHVAQTIRKWVGTCRLSLRFGHIRYLGVGFSRLTMAEGIGTPDMKTVPMSTYRHCNGAKFPRTIVAASIGIALAHRRMLSNCHRAAS